VDDRWFEVGVLQTLRELPKSWMQEYQRRTAVGTIVEAIIAKLFDQVPPRSATATHIARPVLQRCALCPLDGICDASDVTLLTCNFADSCCKDCVTAYCILSVSIVLTMAVVLDPLGCKNNTGGATLMRKLHAYTLRTIGRKHVHSCGSTHVIAGSGIPCLVLE
jgi:hypothetical protein